MLEIITSDALAPRHGFFTRKGGASSGIFAGLNCGTGSSDQAEIVAINRARVADAMGLGVEGLVSVHQVHSPDVVTVTAPFADRPRADAMVTATPGLALAVLTADCQPVLFADAKAGVIGAAHAGWKGARDGVMEATLDAMEALGARRGQITAVIGPCISQTAYEVGQEFFESFTDAAPEARRFFVNGKGCGGCARQGWVMPTGRAIAPTAIRPDSIPTAARPMPVRPITGGRFQSSGSDRGKTAAGLHDDCHQIGNNPGPLFQLSLISWRFQACVGRGSLATIAPCRGTKKP